MDNKIFDKIEESKKLKSVVDIAIDNGIDELNKSENIKMKKRKQKKYAVMAASMSAFIISGIAFSNKTVRASVGSIIEAAFKKVEGEFGKSVIHLNDSKISNGIKLELKEAVINDDELVIGLEIDYSNIEIDDWKLKDGEIYQLRTMESEWYDATSEYNKFEKIIFDKIFAGEKDFDVNKFENIDYTQIDQEEFDYKVKIFEAMYEWGISDEGFFEANFENTDENKDRKGAVEMEASIEGKEASVYKSVVQDESIMPAKYTMKINEKDVKWESMGSDKSLFGKSKKTITMIYDISDFHEKDLNIEFKIEDLELDMDYPVVQDAEWNFSFNMQRKNELKVDTVDINKTVQLGDYGEVELKDMIITDATIKLNYIPRIKKEYEAENLEVVFRITQNGELINRSEGNMGNNIDSQMEYINTLNGDSIELIPEISSWESEIYQEFEEIKINIKK